MIKRKTSLQWPHLEHLNVNQMFLQSVLHSRLKTHAGGCRLDSPFTEKNQPHITLCTDVHRDKSSAQRAMHRCNMQSVIVRCVMQHNKTDWVSLPQTGKFLFPLWSSSFPRFISSKMKLYSKNISRDLGRMQVPCAQYYQENNVLPMQTLTSCPNRSTKDKFKQQIQQCCPQTPNTSRAFS